MRRLNEIVRRKLNIIGQGLEKYLTINWGDHLVFKDTLQFMSCSLEKLASNLKAASGLDGFTILKSQFPENTLFNHLLRKGVFPYTWFNHKDKLEEPRLPPREEFRNDLRNEECSEEEYAHAQEVWNIFNCRKFQDYLSLYLKTDVLLLADVFDRFRKTCKTNFGLDPAHYVSAPQLSLDAMLKLTNANIQLVSDPEMFKIIDANLRGGICVIVKRFAKANNPYLGSKYDPTKPTSYIIYWDANNLYGYAMSVPLPVGNYKWLTEEEISDFTTDKIKNMYEDQPIGYFIECDLEYPKSKHDEHNEYPLAPERLATRVEMLSKTQMKLLRSYNISHRLHHTKLIPNLMDKKKYFCHYMNLQFYISHGLKLTKVHRVISFDQSRWLQPYIQLNQRLRKESKNDFEKEFFKLMANSVYGKMCENQKKRSDIRLVSSEKECKKLTEKPHCMNYEIFTENLAAVEMRKLKAVINSPFPAAFAILEASKLHMYRFHYDVIKAKYENNAELLFTDTDSLMYQIHTQDIYADILEMGDHFDRATYQAGPYLLDGRELKDPTNDKVVGKFKDESPDSQILEFIGLRPKMYSFITSKDDVDGNPMVKEKHRAKGIAAATARTLRHQQYLEQLHTPRENILPNMRIGNKLHEIYTIKVDKRGLCAFDDKRFVMDDGITTLAYGHERITTAVEEIPEPVEIHGDIVLTIGEARREGIVPWMDLPLHIVPEAHIGEDPGQLLRISHNVAPRRQVRGVDIDDIVNCLTDAVDRDRLPIWPDQTLFNTEQQRELLELAKATWGSDEVDLVIVAHDRIAGRIREILHT